VSESGTVRMLDGAAWKRAIARHKGHDVWLSITRIGSEKPTLDQFGYYHAVILPLLAEEFGWGDPAELHFCLKERHLPAIVPIHEWPYRKVGKDEMRYPPSMADLTVEQASAFLQAVLDQAADSGINVPPPRGKEA
jgi:hypothetical protein